MLKIETSVLKQMLKNAMKCSGSNTQISRSMIILITLQDNVLKLVTTDGAVYMEVIRKDVTGDNFYAPIEADKFAKLINKITTDFVEIEVSDTSLSVSTGNGAYDFALQYEDDGKLTSFPDYDFVVTDAPEVVNLSNLQKLVKRHSCVLGKDLSSLQYTGYYFYPSGIITTNKLGICYSPLSFTNKTFLLPAKAATLVESLTQQNVDVYVGDERIKFVTEDIIIYSYKMPEIKNFSINPIQNFINSEFPSSVRVNLSELTAIIDRLSIFTNSLYSNAIELVFAEDFLGVKNARGIGVETQGYLEMKEYAPYTVQLNGELFLSQLKSICSADLVISYNANNSSPVLKFTGDDTQMFIALLTKPEVKSEG